MTIFRKSEPASSFEVFEIFLVIFLYFTWVKFLFPVFFHILVVPKKWGMSKPNNNNNFVKSLIVKLETSSENYKAEVLSLQALRNTWTKTLTIFRRISFEKKFKILRTNLKRLLKIIVI